VPGRIREQMETMGKHRTFRPCAWIRTSGVLRVVLALMPVLAIAHTAYCLEMGVLRTPSAVIYYDPRAGGAADEVARYCPEVTRELENFFGWPLRGKPSVVLARDLEFFERLGGTPLMAAFAVPQRRLIVIHYPKLLRRPGGLRLTLKHEICHLLLHGWIPKATLPRWLDEGLCQMVSEGTADMILDPKGARLDSAVLAGRLIPLAALRSGFPARPELLALAYEESASFVTYIVERWEREGLLRLLGRLRDGVGCSQAFAESLGASVETVEADWRDALEGRVTWFVYLGYYLYELIFAVLALLSMAAFFRLHLKRRARWKEWEDDEA